MHKFFNRSPLDVAIELQGKTLQVGDRKGIITKVKPQYPVDNAHWTDRPLFGPHPADAYVAPYRGKCLLFLRTGTPGVNTCVRIDGLETEDQVLRTPSSVCEALGIDSERTGKVHYAYGVVTVNFP
jgi:3-methyladenine DNA glycosylase Mpg